MRKYNVFSLYVVRVRKYGDTYSFICQYDELSNTYIEILTNERLKADKSDVRPLYEYYSILAVCNYSNMKPLMLNKRELLQKYIEINGFYREVQRRKLMPVSLEME